MLDQNQLLAEHPPEAKGGRGRGKHGGFRARERHEADEFRDDTERSI